VNGEEDEEEEEEEEEYALVLERGRDREVRVPCSAPRERDGKARRSRANTLILKANSCSIERGSYDCSSLCEWLPFFTLGIG